MRAETRGLKSETQREMKRLKAAVTSDPPSPEVALRRDKRVAGKR